MMKTMSANAEALKYVTEDATPESALLRKRDGDFTLIYRRLFMTYCSLCHLRLMPRDIRCFIIAPFSY